MRSRNFGAFLSAALVLISSGYVAAQPVRLPSNSRVTAPDKCKPAREMILRRIEDGDSPSFAVALIKNGKVIWEEAIGWADREAMRPATPRTLYGLASVSKSITATVIDALAARGRLDKSDKVSKILGRRWTASDKAAVITLSQVLDHTSGIPHFFQYEFSDDPSCAYDRERALELYGFTVSEPGSRYVYSNLGYSLLAEVIEKAGAGPFEAVTKRELLDPLGMKETSLTGWMGAKGSARGYGENGEPFGFEYRLAPDGGAGFFTSLDDLVVYAQFHLGINVPKGLRSVPIANSLKKGKSYGNLTYDRGWGILEADRRTFLITDGQMAGSSSAVILVPELGVGAVVLSNRTGGPSFEIASGILDAAVPGLGADFGSAVEKAVQALARPSELPFQDYSGKLVRGDSDVAIRIRFKGEKAWLEIDGREIELTNSGWDRGSLQLVAPGGLGKKENAGEDSRLVFIVWPDGQKLEGFVMEEIHDDRPRMGIPHRVDLDRTPSE